MARDGERDAGGCGRMLSFQQRARACAGITGDLPASARNTRQKYYCWLLTDLGGPRCRYCRQLGANSIGPALLARDNRKRRLVMQIVRIGLN